jgi:hypothetical protein
MRDSAAREFAAELIRERLQELASAVTAAPPVVTDVEEKQNWEEVG